MLHILCWFQKQLEQGILKTFKPISLAGRLYTLLAKILANRLKKVGIKYFCESETIFTCRPHQ